MTSHYLDCRLTVQREDYNFMFARLYKVAHSLIGKNPDANIGLSFPEYNNGRLGEILRFFANEETLKQVKNSESLGVLQDCQIIKIADIHKTPNICSHVCFYRYRLTERLTPRYQKKRAKLFKAHLRKSGINDVNEEDAQKRLEEFKVKVNEQQQYIQFTSSSNGFDYSLSIQKSDFIEKREGKYNSFGLSYKNGATVPFGF